MRLRETNARVCEITEGQEHPDGTVRLSVRELREKLLRAGRGGV